MRSYRQHLHMFWRVKMSLALLIAASACTTKPVTTVDLCNAPYPPKWQRADAPCELCIFDKINVNLDGTIRWNRKPIDRTTLEKYLQEVRAMSPEPVIVLAFQKDTPCEPVRYVRQTMEQILDCKNGFKCRVGSFPSKPQPRSDRASGTTASSTSPSQLRQREV